MPPFKSYSLEVVATSVLRRNESKSFSSFSFTDLSDALVAFITMRLLDARTLDFKEVQDLRSMPKYAILSHTWTDKEVVYTDMVNSPHLARQRPEFAKVKYAAQQALDDGLDYVWIDTCTMDKSSSAELSETINSMFMFYKKPFVQSSSLWPSSIHPAGGGSVTSTRYA